MKWMAPLIPTNRSRPRSHLLTGASSGIGAALCHALEVRGDFVVTAQRRPAGTMHLPCDFSKPQTVREAPCDYLPKSLHSVILCAGHQDRKSSQWPIEKWYEMLTTNALGQIQLIQKLQSIGVIARTFDLTIISSYLARVGSDKYPAYAASKALLESFGKSLVLRDPAIRVNFIYPGRVHTPGNPLAKTLPEKIVTDILYVVDSDIIRNETIDLGK